MNLTTILVCIFFIQMYAAALSQEISISMRDGHLEDVIQQLRKQTNYSFFYKADYMKQAKPITVDLRNVPIKEALPIIFSGQPFKYVLKDKAIIIQYQHQLNKDVMAKPMIQDIVFGVVKDLEGPLPGVSVLVEGTSRGTSTDTEGKYSIAANNGDTLIFRNIGYKELRIRITQSTMDIQMEKVNAGLDEVVVVGYGTQKKASVTGSVAMVNSDELTKTPIAQVSNMLAGRVPGLVAVQSSGLPGGDASSLNIRGFGAPLILIDNVEGNMNALDQNEIESITFLKDASAAVYGSRAGNGVILVTTKRGSETAPTIMFNQGATFQSVTNMLKPASSGQNAELIREEHLQSGKPEETARFTQEEVELFYAGTNPDYANTNWLKEVARKYAPQQQYNLSVKGGSGKVNYYGFLGFLDQESMFKHNGGEYKRYNIRSNVDANISNGLKLQIDLASIISDRDFPWRSDERESSVWQDFWNTEPYYPSSLPDPTKIPYANGSGTGGVHVTSNSEISGYRKTNTQYLTGNVSLQYQVPYVKGLSLKALGNYRQDYTFQKVFERLVDTWTYNHESDIYTLAGSGNSPKLTHRDNRSRVLTGQFYVNFDREIAVDHHLSAMALYEVIDYYSDNILAGRENYLTSTVDYLFAGGVAVQRADGSAAEMGRASYVGRLNYSFLGKYLLESTIRIDESAKFNKDSRRGIFPSISAGWRLSEEEFIKTGLPFVNDLKLRLSYSQTGNDAAVGNFPYLSGYNFGTGYVFGNAVKQSIIVSLNSEG
ncbi:SusC/RagA family TonB-linked outer membrane protein [Olivibacter sitiensis]|uniref:SusC/RagA family TonB-linked outer membrane protein n=1 Tax=Olivibacter sitiensis TaxID=376470 RepID=UPI000683ED8F|nr:SusC/RagA family TonB-linked outer membrane protein [Olivibacter sitiensis]